MGREGRYTLTVTFRIGTDADKAQILVQNRVASAQPALPQSVQTADWPQPPAQWKPAGLSECWDVFMQVLEQALLALEAAKNAGVAENPLQAVLDIYYSEAAREVLLALEDQLPNLLIVSAVNLAPAAEAPEGVWQEGLVTVVANRSAGTKCDRCWMVLESVGQDAEHETLCARCAGNVRALSES